MIAWAIEGLIASTLLMILVLVLRAPVRRAFGAEVAYALWLLPVARLVMPPLPGEWQLSRLVAPLLHHAEHRSIVVGVLTPAELSAEVSARAIEVSLGAPGIKAAIVPPTLVEQGADLLPLLAALWAIGALGFIIYHLASYSRFCARLRAGADAVIAGPVRVLQSRAATGPLAFGIWRKYVAFPLDFAERYDAEEQALALAHELTHHARGDLIANWVALVTLGVHWFNPIAWRAFRAFRADQEMACDARVLAGRDQALRHAYGRAIVKSAHGGAVSAACHLHTINELKGRLRMLAKDRVSRGRRWGGLAGVSALALVALGVTASGTAAAEKLREQVRVTTGVDLARFDAPPAPEVPLAPQAPRAPAPAGGVPVPPSIVAPAPEAPEAPVGATPPAPPAPPRAEQAKEHVFIWRDGEGGVVRSHTRGKGEQRWIIERRFAEAQVPEVRDRDCGDGDRPLVEHRQDGKRTTIIVCRNRVERFAKEASERAMRARELAMNTQDIERTARRTALESVRQARASIIANSGLTEAQRAEALKGIDEAIAELSSGRD